MKILFITQYFYPETEVGGIRIAEIARNLRMRGHEPAILTGFPNYPTGKLLPVYRRKACRCFREDIDGLPVYRVPLYPSHSKRTKPRLANYLSFASTASIRSLAMSGFDAVVATSPPLTTGIPACVASALHHVPFILDVRDLWPECAVELGYLSNPGARALAYRLEQFLYRRAGRIVCVSKGIRDDIVGRGVDFDKCAVVTNGIDTDLFHPGASDKSVEQLKSGGNTVGIYLGSLSAYHGLEQALGLLERLRQFSYVQVVFCGGGSAEQEFRAEIEARKLNNAVFLQAPSRRQMPGLIASSDFCLAFVKESSFSRWLLSSKIFMYMACGRPIYAAAAGETRRIIEEAGAGYVATPNPEGIRQLAEQIGAMRNRTLPSSWGRNGRVYALRHCSWQMIAASYERFLAEATGRAEAKKRSSLMEIPYPK